MLTIIEVFVVKAFPYLEICQLPNIQVDTMLLAEVLKETKITWMDTGYIDKTIIEKCFTDLKFKNLIITKDGSDYMYFDTYMTDFLEILNKARRLNNLKAFW